MQQTHDNKYNYKQSFDLAMGPGMKGPGCPPPGRYNLACMVHSVYVLLHVLLHVVEILKRSETFRYVNKDKPPPTFLLHKSKAIHRISFAIYDASYACMTKRIFYPPM